MFPRIHVVVRVFWLHYLILLIIQISKCLPVKFVYLLVYPLAGRVKGRSVGPVDKTDPPLEAVILVRGRGEGFSHCRLDAMLFWAPLGYI